MVHELAAIQNRIGAISQGFACVPAETLHVTLAELLAGEHYQYLSHPHRIALINRAKEIVSANLVGKALRAQIMGLSSFPGVIVALVDFPDPSSYDCFLHLRNQLHSDALLVELGVRAKRAFEAHVTLAPANRKACRLLN